MNQLADLRIKVFADGADVASMVRLASLPYIQGLTTNPTLMRQAGVVDYQAFAHEVLANVPEKPISFEVFADDFAEMRRQALLINSWGANVFVKIPVSTTDGTPCKSLIADLVGEGVKVNVTALMTQKQVEVLSETLDPGLPAVVSVFAGRIADTGRDPIPIMLSCLDALREVSSAELLWASPREFLNIIQADEIGCHIITVTPDLLKKAELIGKDLDDFSMETVQMFYRDAHSAGYVL